MKKILIIEDERSIAELEKDYLEINGFSVEVEPSGEKGVQNALRNSYDLIILDLMLPEIDGFEICKQIRSQSNVPILIVSAKSEDIDKIRGLGLGADDYITKPFNPAELVARAKAHISRFERLVGMGEGKSDVILNKGLQINRAARRVFVNGTEVILTTKEFDLLVYLAIHPNRVFSKEDLFDRVWKMDSLSEIATVPVYIKRIREKIEEDKAKPQYIETVWGAGYRFKA